MVKSKDGLLAFFVICIATCGLDIGDGQFTANVVELGAAGDGHSDDSPAFIKAWEMVCGASTSADGVTPTLHVPMNKTFLLQPAIFEGPCNSSSVHIQVLGNIVSPNTLDAWKTCPDDCWLCFTNVENLIINGSGLIDGRGSAWWMQTQSDKEANSCSKPTALHFNRCDNLELSGLTHLNPPKNHISISNCDGVSIYDVNIIAPDESPNTDGIDISMSSHVNIYNSYIGTGDDCVAVVGGSSFINVTNVICGPGHGISVGSLGQNGANDTVEEVHVQNCTFNRTQNGARIKTWPGGLGHATKISFVEINVLECQNPIIIDQFYSNGHAGSGKDKATAVAVSKVLFSDFEGTSASLQATTLNCSKAIGCTDIIMDKINITSSKHGNEVLAFCKNARGIISSSSLDVPCLQNEEMEPILAPTPYSVNY